MSQAHPVPELRHAVAENTFGATTNAATKFPRPTGAVRCPLRNQNRTRAET